MDGLGFSNCRMLCSGREKGVLGRKKFSDFTKKSKKGLKRNKKYSII